MLNLVLNQRTVLFFTTSDFPTENPRKQKSTILILTVSHNWRKIFSNGKKKTQIADF